MRSNSPRTGNFICAIDLAGLASVLFVLAILMMFHGVLGRRPHYADAGIDVPVVSNPAVFPHELREDAMRVAVSRQGDIFFNSELVKDIGYLPALMREQLRLGSEKKVYVRADGRARYRTVEDVVDAIHSAGLEQVAFLAYERRLVQNR